MKIWLLLFALLLSFPYQSASGKSQATLSGRITGSANDSITLNDQVAKIDPSGNFTFHVALEKPRNFVLQYRGQQLDIFLEPKQKLFLSFNAVSILPTARFKGGLAPVNTYLLGQQATNTKLNQYLNANWTTLFSLPEDEFVTKIATMRTQFVAPLRQLRKRNPNLNKWFVTQQETDFKYSFDWFIVVYPELNGKFTGKKTLLSDKA